ncbi:MAG: ferredoxin [Candidatus Sulfobium sp.]|jgi:ferredoxin
MSEHRPIPYIDYSVCTGCGACAEIYPAFFEMKDGRPWVIHHEMFIPEEHPGLVHCCPFRAITVE